MGDHFFGETIAEVVFLGIAAEVFKGQDEQLGQGRGGAFVRDGPWFIFLLSGIPVAPVLPGDHLGTQRINRTQLGVLMAMNGKAFFLFPSLDGTDTALQETRDLFPGIKAIVLR
ncbi:MAG: hypothetical protein WB421_02575 [Terriglobales bacterium]